MQQNNTLPEAVQNQIFQQAEDLYNLLDEKAREVDSYDFGLPMFDKQKQPIVDLLTVWATRYQEVLDVMKRIERFSQSHYMNNGTASMLEVHRLSAGALNKALARKGGSGK